MTQRLIGRPFRQTPGGVALRSSPEVTDLFALAREVAPFMDLDLDRSWMRLVTVESTERASNVGAYPDN